MSLVAYCEVALGALASCQPFTYLMCDLMFASSDSRNGSISDCVFLEFDGHLQAVARRLDLERTSLR